MKNDPSRPTVPNGTGSPARSTGMQKRWLAAASLILGIFLGNSVTRQNLPAAMVFVLTLAGLYVMVQREHGSPVLIGSVMFTMVIAWTNPSLLALFSTGSISGLLWRIVGATAGFGLLAACLAAIRRPAVAVVAATHPAPGRPRRAVTSVDLLLTTVSKIPTFVRRLSPLPRSLSPEAQPKTPVEYVCRALPTPPQSNREQRIRRWPGRMDTDMK